MPLARAVRPILLALTGVTLAKSPLVAQTMPAAPPASSTLSLPRFSGSQVDKTADPCVDFQQYVCGAFFKENPIPDDQVAWGKGSVLRLWNETILRETLEAAASAQKPGPSETQIGDYWGACMDEPGIEKASAAVLRAELQPIDALKDKRDLVNVIARIHMRFPSSWQGGNNQTDTVLFGFGPIQSYDDATHMIGQFDQAGMNLPGRDYYLAGDERSKSVREEYVRHVERMLVLAGRSAVQAKSEAAVVLALETDLARAAMDNVTRRDPKNTHNAMTLAQVQALVPALDLSRYLALVKAPATTTYEVSSPDFFRGLQAVLTARPLEDWKAYLRYTTAHLAAPMLGKALVDEDWGFHARVLTGAKQPIPRWRRCVRAADRDLGEALGQSYVKRAFPPENKQRNADMVKAVAEALNTDVDELAWMTPATKARAKEKLAAILHKVGYPDTWRDYAAMTVTRTSYLGNVQAATAFELNRSLQKIGKPIDRMEWGMTPPTINAYYDPQMNTINFPAGILQPPLFDASQDLAVNLGGIGSVMGHEITHGFDDQGRKFDGKGNLRDWWTPEDAKAYEARAKCISDQYTHDVPELGVKTNGLLTLGEDSADLGGTYLALIALETSLKKEGRTLASPGAEGLTEAQRFFLGLANKSCTQLRPEMARQQILTNPHSLTKYRVNNVVANMPEFASAFGCTKGQPMARENACRVW